MISRVYKLSFCDSHTTYLIMAKLEFCDLTLVNLAVVYVRRILMEVIILTAQFPFVGIIIHAYVALCLMKPMYEDYHFFYSLVSDVRQVPVRPVARAQVAWDARGHYGTAAVVADDDALSRVKKRGRT
jgi:hypothetical protein